MLSMLALASFAAAQPDAVLRPSETATIVWELDLASLTPPDRPTGLAALLAVPGMRTTLGAYLTRQGSVVGELANGGRAPGSLTSLLVDGLDWSAIERVVFAARIAGDRPAHVVLLDHAERPAGRAAAVFDGIDAELRRRDLAVRPDSPWPDARRIALPEDTTWLAQRGCQVLLGDGEMGLALVERVPSGGGSRLSCSVAVADLGPRAAAWLATARSLGYTELTAIDLDQRIDHRGYEQSLVCRGTRSAPISIAPALATAPRLPKLPGQLVCLRACVDANALLRSCTVLVQQLGGRIDEDVASHLADVVAGPVAIGVAAPVLLYPRIAIAVPLRAGHGLLDWLAAHAARLGLVVEERPIDGVRTAMVTLPGVPAALRPACCVIDDVLWLAETPGTLRALRRGLATAEDVFADAAATACAAPVGASVLAEAWFDCEALWARGGATWTAMLSAALAPNVDSELWQTAAIVEPDVLPAPAEAAATLGRGRAVVFAGSEGFGVRVAAPTIGPMLSLAGGLVLPQVPSTLAMAIESRRRERAVQSTQARAIRLGIALRAWRAQHGALPPSITDLAALLPRADHDPFVAPHATAIDLETLRRESFGLAPPGATATADLPWIPWQPMPAGTESPPAAARAIWAFCRFAYLGHHVVVFDDGAVAWVRAEKLGDLVAASAAGRSRR